MSYRPANTKEAPGGPSHTFAADRAADVIGRLSYTGVGRNATTMQSAYMYAILAYIYIHT